ncbi:hypothetical protein CL658_03620 [bacterium]|nr:hypothetical protein [bacterium]
MRCGVSSSISLPSTVPYVGFCWFDIAKFSWVGGYIAIPFPDVSVPWGLFSKVIGVVKVIEVGCVVS